MWPFNTGDCSIEVTEGAGLIVIIHNHTCIYIDRGDRLFEVTGKAG
jgi:hypothetical protein